MSDLERAAARALDAAASAGADHADAWCEESTGRQVRAYEGGVESLKDAGGRGLGLRVFLDSRSGFAYGTDLSDAGLAQTAGAAVAAARVTDPDEHAGLPEAYGTTDVPGLASPQLARWTTEQKVELALAVERAARAVDGISQVEDTVYSDSESRVALASTGGFAAAYEATAAWSYCSAFAGEGADLMTGLGVGLARDPAALDPEAIGLEAAERALALRGARQPSTRRCPVVLDHYVAASFLGIVGRMLSADAVQRGRSLFAEREGEEIASPRLSVADDATDPDGLASAPFDGEGSPARRTPLIAAGRLETFVFDVRTARRAARATTSNATRSSYRTPPSVGTTNLVLEPGDEDLASLCRRAGDGLLVTDVIGLHSGVNPVSGTFSVGANGRLIEGGELGAAVREITIASDLVTMLRSVDAVGSEGRWMPLGDSVRAAPLLISEMVVSGS